MDVQFHEDEVAFARPAAVKKASLLTRFIFKLKLAKTEAEAQRVMLVVALLCLGAALLVVLNFMGVF
jgi:hypothetical protein